MVRMELSRTRILKLVMFAAALLVGACADTQAGTFPITGPTSLMQAVALAGGTTEDANARRVAVFRTIGGKREAAAFDLAAIRHGQSQDPQIYPGDIVVVDGSGIKEGFK